MISYLVPTIGRASLVATLESIEQWEGDELLLVGDESLRERLSGLIERHNARFIPCSPGGDWGHTERNLAMPLAKGKYLAHIDDDDVYTPGARTFMAYAIQHTPGRPVLFRMRFPNGLTLWQEPVLRCGNVGTPMILIPNELGKLGQFRPFVGGDCAFLEEMRWRRDEIVWSPEVIALLGHNV